MTRHILVPILALLLQACATTAPDTVADDLPELSEYGKDPFVPVNLYVNANQHVGAERGQLLEHAARRLEDSGAFLRVDRGTQRWLYSLQLRFRPQATSLASEWPRRLLSIVTLGLVPVPMPQTEFLEVEVFQEPEPLASFSYVQPYDDYVSLYALGDPGRDTRAAMDLVLKRMMAELARSGAIPRAREFDEALEGEPLPPPPPKKPAKPKGTPT